MSLEIVLITDSLAVIFPMDLSTSVASIVDDTMILISNQGRRK